MPQLARIFDRCFDDPGDPGDPAAATGAFLKAGDVEALRREAFAAGEAAGRAAAATEADATIAVLLERIVADCQALLAAEAAWRGDLAATGRTLFARIVRQTVPVLAESAAAGQIASLLGQCIEAAPAGARIDMHLSPAMADALAGRLVAGLAPDSVAVRPDPQLADTDCRLAWQHGGADYRFQEAWARIAELLPPADESGAGQPDPAACAATRADPHPASPSPGPSPDPTSASPGASPGGGPEDPALHAAGTRDPSGRSGDSP